MTSSEDFEQRFSAALALPDLKAMLALFDEDAQLLRRMLTRSSYSPDERLRGNVLTALTHLCRMRAPDHPLFFKEIIRRHIWAMNDEGGNIEPMAPEMIAAVICGSPSLYDEFVTIMYHAAIDEPLFYDSLQAALLMLEANDVKNVLALKRAFGDHQKRQ